jgi:hypothetical protein
MITRLPRVYRSEDVNVERLNFGAITNFKERGPQDDNAKKA